VTTHLASLDEWLRLLETRHPSTIDLGLERVGKVWRELGQPRPAPRVFTVAGTNGKGSTVTYIDGMLSALGYRSATYTSPHVFRYNERVRILGHDVTDAELVWAFNSVEQARGSTSLTYFEQGTLAAFLLMHRAGLDFAVLEVGLGGRLDAVNLVDADCAVITPIGLDHQEYLGPDRYSIGREKAGILREGRPLVCGEADPPASVLERAGQLGVPAQRLDREFHIEPSGSGLLWRGAAGEISLPMPPLAGRHQPNNLATAVAALLTLVPQALDQPARLAEGIRRVQLPGRLQVHPLDPRVWVDVGHNPLAAEVVAQTLQESGQSAAVCVLAMLRDKDAAGAVGILEPFVQRWYCAGLAGERGRSGEALAALVADVVGSERVSRFPTVEAALKAAVRLVSASDATAASQPARVLVFGSFHTAAEALLTDPD
jgi:dihydrofolate synthase/folylpolyglutamate synthase